MRIALSEKHFYNLQIFVFNRALRILILTTAEESFLYLLHFFYFDDESVMSLVA
jgi:hypothetical protein